MALFKTGRPTVVLTSHAGDLPRKARPDMALERDNTAERLARIDKLPTREEIDARFDRLCRR